MPKRAVFLDRDGVINRDSPDYIKTWSEFVFLPRSVAAIRMLTHAGFTLILITNQSAVNRRITTRQAVDDIHTRMRKTLIRNGGEITGVFLCPHTPEENCGCRKPKPGMIHSAAHTHGIDLSASVMVGDSVKDMQCAANAGCGAAVLVRTGNGVSAEKTMATTAGLPDHVALDLYAAAQWIVARK